MKKHLFDKESRQLGLPRRKRLRYAIAREITRHFSTITIEHRGGVVSFDDAEFAANYFAENEDAGLSLRYSKFVPWMCVELATVDEANAVASIIGAVTGHHAIIVETFTGFSVLHRIESEFSPRTSEQLALVFSQRFPSVKVGALERETFLYVYEAVSIPAEFSDNFQTRINVTDVSKVLGARR